MESQERRFPGYGLIFFQLGRSLRGEPIQSMSCCPTRIGANSSVQTAASGNLSFSNSKSFEILFFALNMHLRKLVE